MSYERVRARDERVFVPAFTDQLDGIPSHLNMPNGGSLLGVNSIMTDFNNGDYKKRRARGEIVMSKCYLEKTTTEAAETSCTFGPHPVSPTLVLHGNYGGYVLANAPQPTVPSVDQDQLVSLALTKCYAKMNQSPIMGGEIAHDLTRTLGMLRRPLKGSFELIGKMLKYKKIHLGKTTKSATKASANAWLEYRYGWSPLVMDANQAFKQSFMIHEQYENRRLVARASENAMTDSSLGFTDVNADGILLSGTTAVKKDYRISAGVIYSVKAVKSGLEAANAILGFRPNDLIALGWEIIPYSFVVDWFANIGTWISAITPAPGISILGSWVTGVTESRVTVTGTMKYSRPNPTLWYTDAFGTVTETTVHYSRAPNPALPNSPVLSSQALSVKRSLDAVSLSLAPINRGLTQLYHPAQQALQLLTAGGKTKNRFGR
jgi:hypothetical protein